MITRSQAQFETRVPADTQDDDRSAEKSSLEQCFDRNERLYSVIIPDHDLFAPEPQLASVPTGYTSPSSVSGSLPFVLEVSVVDAVPARGEYDR
jgi:hypothetical protein